MDLLGYLRQEAGNQKAARREGAHGTERRNAQALLLARLPSSLKQSERQGTAQLEAFAPAAVIPIKREPQPERVQELIEDQPSSPRVGRG